MRNSADNQLVGHVDWLSNDRSFGREYAKCDYDQLTRILTIEGTKLMIGDDLTLAADRAKMSPDGLKINGSWSSEDKSAIPGDWEATRSVIK